MLKGMGPVRRSGRHGTEIRYGETGDFSGLRVRNSLGTGVRLLLPFIIVRVDYGYPLNQDLVNDKGRWYFAIGQAF